MSMVFVVTNGAEIDSAWTTEHEAQSQAATLNAPGGEALAWSVVGTKLGGPLERLYDEVEPRRVVATEDDRRIARALLNPLDDRQRRAVYAVVLEIVATEEASP